jgi:hypothetical protein
MPISSVNKIDTYIPPNSRSDILASSLGSRRVTMAQARFKQLQLLLKDMEMTVKYCNSERKIDKEGWCF